MDSLRKTLREGTRRLARLDRAGGGRTLREARLGLEKESLRVDPSGYLAETPHPRALGSTLTHPHITTDFSEALVEFVTPPFTDARDTLRFLQDLHVFTYRHLGDELLWCASMPCMVSGDDAVPIADYGPSNVGIMKRIYREGLSHRYGRVMQTIAGIHFNYSLPEPFWAYLEGSDPEDPGREVIDAGYFGCVRNFLRFGWLVPLLFGSSPAVCKTFLGGNTRDFQAFDKGTWFHRFATSLRMSDVGYKNSTQASLRIDYDSLDSYVDSLTSAIETPHAEYERIGVKVDGRYRQLNANILQIENEFYSSVRPKQVTRSGEKPTLALRRRGVRYLEVRSLDLDPFEPVGVSLQRLRFLEALVVLCAAAPSPSIGGEREDINRCLAVVPKSGRDPDLSIRVLGVDAPVQQHAREILEALQPVCTLLDGVRGGSEYRSSLEHERNAVESFELLPSARILQAMRDRKLPFFRFAMEQTQMHADTFRRARLSKRKQEMLEREAKLSLEQQRQIERSDRMSFDQYLARYFNQTLDQRETLLG